MPPVPVFPTPPSSIFPTPSPPVATSTPPQPSTVPEIVEIAPQQINTISFNKQPPIAHTQEHQKLQQQQLQYNHQHQTQSKLPNRQLEAAKSLTKPLFSTNQVALLRMSNQIEN